MNINTEERAYTDQEPSSKSMEDSICNSITFFLAGLLSFLCQAVQTTPASIAKHNPNVRPNSPPAAGGISSLGN